MRLKTLDTELAPGDLQLYDNYEPSLLAGSYMITVTQSLPNPATDNFDQDYPQAFDVAGAQFTIDPSEVHSRFPDDDANGDFSDNLPFVILENPLLPWERVIDPGQPTSVPWMALLVLQENELAIDPVTGSSLFQTTVQELLAPVDKVVKPAIEVTDQTVLESSVQTILIKTEVFQAVVPRLQELPFLAHVRTANPANQAENNADHPGWYSVIMANRFPNSQNPDDDTGAKNYVHLVSLEGLSAFLVDTPSWNPTDATQVQMVSLASWTFISAQKPGQTFAELAENLVNQQAGNPDSELLRIPVNDDGSTAATRLLHGYVPLTYQTIVGENTFAWYRGPFSPVVPQPLPEELDYIVSPAAAMIYDQENGVFDQSYAAAWTIGRLAALADPVFVQAIQTAKVRMHEVATRMHQNARLPHLQGASLAELADPRATRKAFFALVQDGLAQRVDRVLTARSDDLASFTRARRGRLANQTRLSATPAAASMQAFVARDEVSAYLSASFEEHDSGPLTDWLANLVLLYDVPFNHLVADQRMLPTETVRFFHVDQGWLTALFDGAVSTVIAQSLDQAYAGLMRQTLLPRLPHAVAQKRARALRLEDPAPLPPAMPLAGMLLRSALVSGWPGLQVNATNRGTDVEIMRMDRLSPNILLVLWAQVPDTVTISQPSQGIVFGVDDGWITQLRSLDADTLGAPLSPVQDFPSSGDYTQFMRPTVGENGDIGDRVLRIEPASGNSMDYLVPAMANALGRNTLTPSQLAIELFKTPELVAFDPS